MRDLTNSKLFRARQRYQDTMNTLNRRRKNPTPTQTLPPNNDEDDDHDHDEDAVVGDLLFDRMDTDRMDYITGRGTVNIAIKQLGDALFWRTA